mgnify:CR=1 FL=1
MRKMIVAGGALLVAGVCGAVVAGARLEPPSWLNSDMDKGMQAWEESAKLGEPHEYLGKSLGEYDVVMRMWMDPSGAPMESKGTAKRYWKIEGRWLMEDLKGEVMGQPYQGFGITGWDNTRKQFVTTWSDNMSTSLMVARGSISADMKTMTMIGEMDEPMTGEIGKAVMYKSIEKSPDVQVFQAYEILYGEPVKVMEIEYTRKK